MKANPYAEADDAGTVHVGFTADELSGDAKAKLAAFPTEVDSFHVAGRDIYWLCRIKVRESKFSGAVMERILKRPSTWRNLKTVRRLAQLL